MSKSSFVSFKAIKAAITMEQVLTHYGLMEKFKRKGDSLNGPCPIHKGTNPTQFRVSISKNIFNCFSECKHGGNVLDFIAKMEDVSIHAAALKAVEWFHIDPEIAAGNSDADREVPIAAPKAERTPAPRPAAKEPREPEDTSMPNKPLKFRLEKLERSHPHLTERGIKLETLVDFGAGFCAKGMMAGRIAIPIHNPNGEVVAYAGRLVGEHTDDNPKYKLPPGFRKSLELFNIDRASKESPEQPLVIVEGFMREELKGFFSQPERIGKHLAEADRNLSEKSALLEAHRGEIQKLKDEIAKTHKLYLADQISVEGFGAIAKPAEARLGQLQLELPKLEAEVDFMRVNKLSADDVMHEATTMYDQWPTLASEDKRKVMEALVEKVTIGNGEIDITFSCVPSSEDVCKSQRGLGPG